MYTDEHRQRVLADTLDRMRKKDHLPQDLVLLLGNTVSLQLASGEGLSLDCAKPEPFGLPTDLNHARDLAHKILDEIVSAEDKMPTALAEAAGILKGDLADNALDWAAAAAEVLAGKGPLIDAWAQRFPEAPGSLRFLLLAALEPSFRAGAPAMAELKGIQADEIHSPATCPLCGRPPYILELRGREGFRYANCSLCHFEYRVPRMACPICNSDDPEHLKYFTVAEEPGFRVETCDGCQAYVKTLDFRELDRVACPSLNDLESLALDFLAEEQGYTRFVPSVWGI